MLNHKNSKVKRSENLRTVEELTEIIPFQDTEIQFMIAIWTFKDGVPVAYTPEEIKEYVNITGGQKN
jgi:hypothetical protein